MPDNYAKFLHQLESDEQRLVSEISTKQKDLEDIRILIEHLKKRAMGEGAPTTVAIDVSGFDQLLPKQAMVAVLHQYKRYTGKGRCTVDQMWQHLADGKVRARNQKIPYGKNPERWREINWMKTTVTRTPKELKLEQVDPDRVDNSKDVIALVRD